MRHKLRSLVLIVVFAIFFGVLISRHSVLAGLTKQWHTVEKINGYSPSDNPFPKISDGGYFVVFHSHIANLVPDDSNNFCDTDGNGVADNSCADIFAYDRETKNIKLISVSTNGTQGNQRSAFPSISSDARYIAFSSQANNLVPDGSHICLYFGALLHQCTDTFVHDKATGITERVSVASDGRKANGNSNFPSISADGRYIAFSSDASNLIPNGVHICRDSFSSRQCNHIFVHDRLTGTTELVSVASNGEKGNKGSYQPSISADGRHIVFLSSASNFISNDNNGQSDVFIRHLDTEETEIVSIASYGTQGNLGAEFGIPAVSEDGRYVAFVSRSTNLVTNDTNDSRDVFVRDLQTRTTVRASVATDDSQANNWSGTYDPSISSNGRYILFDSSATNLVPNDTNGQRDIFIRDLYSATTTRVSLSKDGNQANNASFAASIDPEGNFVAYSSFASNLTPDDLNDTADMFVAEASTTPPFPYFSQKDSLWEEEIYDHADSIGPFFCGTTIAGCGCAITSSAMLLEYYGVAKGPNGQPTTPQTLNDWLIANNGYAFGAVKWNSIASYAFKAWQVYNTQSKIKFTGVGGPNDYSTLDQDLNHNSPPILQQPGHFIVATGIQSPTYSINDPAWENRKTLQTYGNTFKSMRRFAKTSTDLSAIYISTPAPTELLITDTEGRKTGKDAAGNIYNQIPDSYYALEPAFLDQSSGNPQTPPENLGVNTLLILTPDKQNFTLQTFTESPTYSIEFSGYDEDGDITVQGFDQTSADQYDIEYTENGNHFEFFQTVEIDARHSAKPNPFNPNARILPVSILASGDFDPQTVDINTIETNPGWNLLKASTILIGPRLQNEKSLLLLLENSGDYEEEICVRGKTLSGKPFRGCDTIRVVGNSP